jgi:Cytochrome c2
MTRIALMLLALSLAVAACDHESADLSMRELTGGNAHRGRQIVKSYGCTACHLIPGVPGPDARVGPPLGGVATRAFIAGVLPNQPANMIHWIRDPQGVDPKTAMPDMGVSARDARDIAGYLYTLR